MKSLFKTTTICAAAFLIQSTYAGVSFVNNPIGSAWNGSPVYVSAVNANYGTLTVAQGDPAITGANGLMSETFTPTSSFVLASFNLTMQVTFATNYTIHLYDLGPAGTVSVSSSAATYTPGTDLFSGLSLALGTMIGAIQGEFDLSGADQVSLLANEEYALEVWTPSAAGQNGFLWYRNAIADPGGQMFSGGDDTLARKTLAGNGQAGGAPRTGGLALYAVPEPSIAALAGLGIFAVVSRKRK